jgi:hypothetical protein
MSPITIDTAVLGTGANRQHQHQHRNENSSSSTASSDFFSPVSITFLQQHNRSSSLSPPAAATMPLEQHRRNSSTSNHHSGGHQDRSWIGARLSPIHSFDREQEQPDDEEDDDNNNTTDSDAERHRAMHDTMQAAQFVTTTTATAATGGGMPANNSSSNNRGLSLLSHPTHPFDQNNNEQRRRQQSLHPIWRSPEYKRTDAWGRDTQTSDPYRGPCCRRSSSLVPSVGLTLCVISGLILATAWGVDLFDWYRNSSSSNSNNNGVNTNDSTATTATGTHFGWEQQEWGVPCCLIPSAATLVRFGALSPIRGYDSHGYVINNVIAILTSLLICTSVVEWLGIVASWRLLHVSATKAASDAATSSAQKNEVTAASPPTAATTATATLVLFVSTALVGVLWMWCLDWTQHMVVGSLSWGTCGVLCSTGMQRPQHRFELFLFASLLVLLSLLDRPYGSVMGCTGGAFFGWAMGANEQQTSAPLSSSVHAHATVAPATTGKLPDNLTSFLGTGFAVGILLIPVLSLVF